MLGFYVSPTAYFIRRRDLGLKSHPKDWRSPGSDSRPIRTRNNLSKLKGAVTYHRIALTDAERTEKNAKNVYPVEKVVSVAMKVVAESVRSAYNARVTHKYRTSNGQTTVN